MDGIARVVEKTDGWGTNSYVVRLSGNDEIGWAFSTRKRADEYAENLNAALAPLVIRREVADKLADVLEKSVRLGAEKDEPEGSRYILISDTLAKNLVSAYHSATKGEK